MIPTSTSHSLGSQTAAGRLVAGLTPASLVCGVFCMLLLSIIIHYGEVILGLAAPAEHALALPAIWIFVLLGVIVGVVKIVARVTLLTRAERLCVLYAMLIAAPLMTQGFWHRIISVIATNPRAGDWAKLDALNDKLWPHGPNLVQDFLTRPKNESLRFTGTHSWEVVEHEAGRSDELPVLTNVGADEVSSVFIDVPLVQESVKLSVGEPVLVSVLLRPSQLGANATYFARLHGDDGATIDVFRSSEIPPRTFQYKTGFVRLGAYGIGVPQTKEKLLLEIGLEGEGRLELFDPKLFSVATLEAIYRGRTVIYERDFLQLPENERGDQLVIPERMWSLAGLKYVLCGYIPIYDWIVPLTVWTSFILLVLLGTLAIVVIMRRQWLDNERYPMPLTRISETLADPSRNVGQAKTFWRNGMTWAGFSVAMAYLMLRAAAFYFPGVPDPTIRVALSDYLSGAGWGGMFDGAVFSVQLLFVSLLIFTDLNVLLSIVVGAWLFRAQSLAGEATGWNRTTGYPFRYEQSVASYMTYAVLIVIFTRRHIFAVLRSAWKGGGDPGDEPMSYRSAVLLLLGTFVAVALWAMWLEIGVAGMLLFFLFLLAVGMVAAKLRMEAGLPFGYFSPGNAALFLTALGGIPLFGPEAMIFCYVASFFLAPTVFFLIPGAQLELVELGRRWGIRRGHLLVTIVLAILGGMLIGGWAFLSNAYALGGDSMVYRWAFDSKPWYFFTYNDQLHAATNEHVRGESGTAAAGADPRWYAFGYAAGGTAILSLLRQWFAGFWFHPLGWILSTTHIMDGIWGSALVAWCIRGLVLWLGGAQTVRNKLQPFFIGVFLGAVLAELLLAAYAAYLRANDIRVIFNVL